MMVESVDGSDFQTPEKKKHDAQTQTQSWCQHEESWNFEQGFKSRLDTTKCVYIQDHCIRR